MRNSTFNIIQHSPFAVTAAVSASSFLLRPSSFALRPFEDHFPRPERPRQLGDARLGVELCRLEDAAPHRFAADALFRVLAGPRFELLVGAAEDAGAAVDDVGLAVVEARDEDHGRREADDDRAVRVAL